MIIQYYCCQEWPATSIHGARLHPAAHIDPDQSFEKQSPDNAIRLVAVTNQAGLVYLSPDCARKWKAMSAAGYIYVQNQQWEVFGLRPPGLGIPFPTPREELRVAAQPGEPVICKQEP